MSNQQDWRGAVEQVRRTMTARGRESSGYYSIEGTRLHERALRAGKRVEIAIHSSSFNARQDPRNQTLLYDLLLAGCRLATVPDHIMAELTDGRDLGAIIGLIRLPHIPALEQVIGGLEHEKPLFLVAADVKDPGNTGALMRTGLASGVTAFVACGVSDPFHPKAVRTSMGSLFKLPILVFDDSVQAAAALAAENVQCLGLAVDGGTLLPYTPLSTEGVAVFVGSEAWGLSPEEKEALVPLVSIPMQQGVDSYSVNAAAAIALYEVVRRRLDKRG